VTDLALPQRLFPVAQESRTSDDYYTPAWVFERMGIEFDLDVCAPPGGIPWIPARRYFTQEDDGLARPWEGRVWMNPPFSNSAPWVRRFIAHGHGVCLVPHAKSRWHIDLWTASAGVALPEAGFFDFVGGSIFIPVWFAAFGDECVEAIGRLGTVRRIA
jgi:hypothetical protein